MIAPAKINLGLSVLWRRPDNYHEIKSIFLKTDWGDTITLAPTDTGELRLTSDNALPASRKHLFEAVSERGNPAKNILFKTWRFLSDITGIAEGIEVNLVKRIPPGGGLGGGSTNAAALVLYWCERHGVPLDPELITQISRIGADIPFFLRPGHALVGGIGEKISPLPVANGYGILCIPAVAINTAELYSWLKKPLQKDPPAEPWDKLESGIKFALEKGNWSYLQGKLENDFEKVVFPDHPEIAEIKEKLLGSGADYSSMTGSGSCIYALCSDNVQRSKVADAMKQLFPALDQVLFDF